MKLFRHSVLVVIIVCVAALGSGAVIASPDQPASVRLAQTAQTPDEICAAADTAAPENRTFEKADQVLAEGVDYWAVICTEAGAIYLDLYQDESPITVNNFVFLAQQGFYNSTTFHRVLPGFMAQGGDPTGTGSGGPGYEFEDETSNGLVFDQVGLLAMANAGANTNGSQFFITYGLPNWLDGAHTVFGRVYQGLNTAELLTPRDPEQGPETDGAALNTVVIIEDPASVDAAPDGPPNAAHFQALFELVLAGQINELFVMNPEFTHTYDLDGLAALYGEGLADTMRTYLESKGFVGGASLVLKLGECPANPSDLPIWGLSFQIVEFSEDGVAEEVAFDDARAETLIGGGAFEAFADPADVAGRVFNRALAEVDGCGPTGRFYRLDMPYGRYLLTVDLLLDSDFVNETSEPTAAQYLGYVMQDMVLGSLSGTLDRGSSAAE
ncbi:MAG: peptidylprolyl isomerase [Chloroflexi bacterium]|nr:peptidylprolyl isomerase [Chloroflexota bacterium]